MIQSMLKNTKTIRAKNAVSAGQTTQTATFSRAGFNGAFITVLFGTLTSTTAPVITVKSGAQSNGGDATAITGATVSVTDADSNKVALVDVPEIPDGDEYITVEVTRPTANAVLDGIVAQLYNPRTMPTTQDTTVLGSALAA